MAYRPPYHLVDGHLPLFYGLLKKPLQRSLNPTREVGFVSGGLLDTNSDPRLRWDQLLAHQLSVTALHFGIANGDKQAGVRFCRTIETRLGAQALSVDDRELAYATLHIAKTIGLREKIACNDAFVLATQKGNVPTMRDYLEHLVAGETNDIARGLASYTFTFQTQEEVDLGEVKKVLPTSIREHETDRLVNHLRTDADILKIMRLARAEKDFRFNVARESIAKYNASLHHLEKARAAALALFEGKEALVQVTAERYQVYPDFKPR